MLDSAAVAKAVAMHERGVPPSEILRFFAQRHDDISVPDLMQLMRDAFSLPYEDVQCIGGWWHDGSGELSDQALDAFLIPAIARRRGPR